ncbi:hypothetical protein CONPUDRAFT_27816, partial [Coniophora puteana RWD-64-598 SS2]
SPENLVRGAYSRFSTREIVFFLRVRNLPISGTTAELVSRLVNHDLHTYHFPRARSSSPPLTSCPSSTSLSLSAPHVLPNLPVELIAEITDTLGDWELARALGLPTSLPTPPEWVNASPSAIALLPGSLSLLRSPHVSLQDLEKDPPSPSASAAASAVVRFGHVHVLDYLLAHQRRVFAVLFKPKPSSSDGDTIPTVASTHGRTAILAWYKHAFTAHPELVPPPARSAIEAAIDGASRGGSVAALDWWAGSAGTAFAYTESALEHASAKGHIAVLEWWRAAHLADPEGVPLLVGRALDAASSAGQVAVLAWWAASRLSYNYDRLSMLHASVAGRLDVLDWWLASGLQVMYDGDVLVGATRHDRADVLEWWARSGLRVEWRMCDIEEALEDAIGGGEGARAWWRARGVDFRAEDREWMKVQTLN